LVIFVAFVVFVAAAVGFVAVALGTVPRSSCARTMRRIGRAP